MQIGCLPLRINSKRSDVSVRVFQMFDDSMNYNGLLMLSINEIVNIINNKKVRSHWKDAVSAMTKKKPGS